MWFMLMVVYTQGMSAKKTKKHAKLSPKMKAVVLPIMLIIAGGAVVLAVIAIIVMPIVNPGSQRGVGADGFQAYQETGTTLGVDRIVTKDQVVKQLGDKAKSVSEVTASNVFNLNGNRTQTATYNFVRTDGASSSVYIDMMFFKNQNEQDGAKITTATMKAGQINGHDAYYMHAQTIGNDREYRLMVVNGLKVYKFAFVQPRSKLTISEVSALAVLKKLALEAKY